MARRIPRTFRRRGGNWAHLHLLHRGVRAAQVNGAAAATFPLPSTLALLANVAGGASNCGAVLNADGTTIYTGAIFLDDVIEFDMSTAYDLDTSAQGDSWDDLANVTMRELRFNGDGTYIYYLDEFDDRISGAPLSVAYDITTAGAVDDEFLFSGEMTIAQSFEFGDSGNKLYIGSQSQTPDIIAEYDLSSPYDVSTAVLNQSLNVESVTSSVRGLTFNHSDGLQIMMMTGDSPNLMILGTLSTAWDISTVTWDTVNTLNLFALGLGTTYGLDFGDNKFYTADFTNSQLAAIG